jgi:SAM-dependent methyltransferase
VSGAQPFVIEPGDADPRRSAPHVVRNAEPIAAVLREVLPDRGLVLEVASGTGEHALHFARAFPVLRWQPSDPDPVALHSIEAWRAASGADNLLPPVQLDARSEQWPLEAADAVVCINMVHISPWEATVGLLAGAARLLSPGAPLILYGAYRRSGVETAPSNLAFDEALRARNPQWGLRLLEDVISEAGPHGFALERVVEMPANNLTIVFRKPPLPLAGGD